MADFPKLIPAFTARVPTDPGKPVGPIAKSGALIHIAIQAGGSVKSEPDYPIKLDAKFVHGADYIKIDPDNKHARLEVQSLLRDEITGGLVRFNYTGTVSLAGGMGKVLRGEADAATTGFGDGFTYPVFEGSSHPSLAALEGKTYVGSGRFVLESGQPVIVEYKISEVSA
ncbi:hypothetical protein QBC34DRAFT_131427 [Podospora aff. communis PSN243]|uniref:Uncharacterized protein n=1 Tax=Podospora aff. communis PSN243 TaxID=3040156 RepID=A0AAV9GHB6_9PEZI|nr:hypothetical protein QBC34DRAFT_131427 [Podospora aff. communis PSN243]